jgi:4-diphosphocytidyl-2-C-methyl-D-erythritol kinase
MTSIHRSSPCKINLLLNVLGRRSDGFHEIETLFHPVHVCDQLSFSRATVGLTLTCSDPRLPVDSTNLVHRAGSAFLERASIRDGVRIHLEKRIPMEAGLGGGSGNAAHTLLGLNELFDRPLDAGTLSELAAGLGSDVVFFLRDQPAVATGRGEQVTWCSPFPALQGCSVVIVHPGFGVPTAWAYRALAAFPEALRGEPGRARQLAQTLRSASLSAASALFYNSFEFPVFKKYPLLALYRNFFQNENAFVSLLSGSGSATFAIVGPGHNLQQLEQRFRAQFGTTAWSVTVPL